MGISTEIIIEVTKVPVHEFACNLSAHHAAILLRATSPFSTMGCSQSWVLGNEDRMRTKCHFNSDRKVTKVPVHEFACDLSAHYAAIVELRDRSALWDAHADLAARKRMHYHRMSLQLRWRGRCSVVKNEKLSLSPSSLFVFLFFKK